MAYFEKSSCDTVSLFQWQFNKLYTFKEKPTPQKYCMISTKILQIAN